MTINPYAPPRPATTGDDAAAPSPEAKLADPGERLTAYLVDVVLLLASFLPTLVVATAMGAASSASKELPDVSLAVGVACALGLQAYQWYLVGTTGQSLAKKWLGLRIVHVDGSPAGFFHGVVVRSWIAGAIGSVPAVGGLFRLGDALAIFGSQRQCWHDLMAGTKVVRA